MRHATFAALALLAVALVVGAAQPGPTAAATRSRAAAPPVYFVSIGGFPQSDVAALSRYFGRKLGLKTGVLPRTALPASAFNRQRKQYVAEKLIEVLQRPVGDPRVVIGLTAEDMYTRDKPDWRYAFSIRDPHGFAVVSRTRMDPRLLGLTPDPGLRMRRLQKMVMKNIGVLAFGHRVSANPRSVLYDSILGLDDLDYMTQEFRPPTASRAKASWLRRANGACRRGVSEAKALIARSSIVTTDDFLTFARASIALQVGHRSQLAAIPPAPEDRSAVRAMLALFKRAGNADRAAVAKLSAHWSEPALKRWLQAGIRFGLALKADALELGSRGCARYFDPATYAR
jgi:predicted Zn-dependent protease